MYCFGHLTGIQRNFPYELKTFFARSIKWKYKKRIARGKKWREKNTKKWKPSIIFILGACKKAVVWTVLYLEMNISIHPFFEVAPKHFQWNYFHHLADLRLDSIEFPQEKKKLKQKRIQRIVDKFLWIYEFLWILQYLLFNNDVHVWRVHAFESISDKYT